jgi:hypothetical protein
LGFCLGCLWGVDHSTDANIDQATVFIECPEGIQSSWVRRPLGTPSRMTYLSTTSLGKAPVDARRQPARTVSQTLITFQASSGSRCVCHRESWNRELKKPKWPIRLTPMSAGAILFMHRGAL